MTPRLVAMTGPLKGRVVSLGEGRDFSIGREPSNRLPISDPLVSRRHCLIRTEEDRSVVRDLESRNGTFVNDVPVRERGLEHGDQVRIGDSLFLFLLEQESVPQEAGEVPDDEELHTRTIVKLRQEDAVYLHPRDLSTSAHDSPRVVQNLDALLRLGLAISSLRELEMLERRLFELIFEVVPADRGTILLTVDGGGEFAGAFQISRDGQSLSFPVSRTLARRVLQDGNAVLCNDALAGGRVDPTSSLIASETRSLVAVPLMLPGRALGVLYVDSTDPSRRFEDDHLQLLAAAGSIAAGPLDNALRLKLLEEENRRLQAEIRVEHNMVGESPRMREVYQFVGKAAPKDVTVLIRGESGTGKELAARAIHQNSPRAEKPFVAINCAALPETLLESELFGHEKGAFTGAIGQKRGKLEVADGGTLFLDEVGELPVTIQVKLLRVLQEREFERLGGTRTIKVDIRLITATNRDLEVEIKAGRFRPDLYFRLNVVSLTMPPLRERREDIPLLSSYFTAKLSQKARRKVTGLSAAARECLLRYGWPGNVRELENAIEHAVVLGSSDLVLPEDLPEAVLETRPAEGAALTEYHDAVLRTKRQLILGAIDRAGGNLTEAAKLLGLHPNYLHRLIRNMNLRAELKKGAQS